MLISVYRGLSSTSDFGDARGTANGDGDGSGAASGVVTAEVVELKSQNGSTREVTTSQHMFPVSIVLGDFDRNSSVIGDGSIAV
jgi:hypothetical protein